MMQVAQRYPQFLLISAAEYVQFSLLFLLASISPLFSFFFLYTHSPPFSFFIFLATLFLPLSFPLLYSTASFFFLFLKNYYFYRQIKRWGEIKIPWFGTNLGFNILTAVHTDRKNIPNTVSNCSFCTLVLILIQFFDLAS